MKKNMSIFFTDDGSHFQIVNTFNKTNKHQPQIMHLSGKEVEEMTTNFVLKYNINDL